MRKVFLLLLLAGLTAPLDAQYRARWVTTGTQDGGGGEPALPIVATELLSSSSTDGTESYASTAASFTEHLGATTFSCGSGNLCLAWVTSTDGDADGPSTPATFTQTGQTWTLLVSVMESSKTLRQSLYYTEGAGAAAAAITAGFGVDTQNGVAFNVFEIENVDLTAGTSGIISTNSQSGANVGTSMTTASNTYSMAVPLSARNSGTAVLMSHAIGQSCAARTAKSGYTEGTSASYSGPTTRARVDYEIGGVDATPTVTLVGACSTISIDWVGIAVEVSPDLSTDVTDPTVIITSPTIGTTYDVSDSAFAFGGSAADNDSIPAGGVTWACATCTPTSGTATGTTSWSASNTLTCSAGAGTANTIIVTAEDPSANTSEDTLVVTCVNDDSIPPVVVVNNPPTLSTTSPNPLASFDGTITDNDTVDRVAYSASGATPSSGDATLNAGAWDFVITVPCSAGGTTTTVEITGYDAADNASQTHTREYVCVTSGGGGDETDPTVTLTSAGGAVSSALATFTGTAFDAVPGGVTLVTGYCTTCTPATWQATGLTTWSKSNITLASGANSLCAVAHDAAGNQSSPSCQTWTYTVPVAFTTNGCVPAQEDVSYTGCTINVTGGDGTYTLTDFGSSLNTGTCTGLTGSQVGQAFVVTGTPTGLGTCSFTVRANDGVQAVVDKPFTIVVQADTDPHAYWTQMQAFSPYFIAAKSRSLRVQSQLNALTAKTEGSTTGLWSFAAPVDSHPWWTYDYAGDSHPEKQDAAKLHVPRERPTYECTEVYGKVIFSGTPGAIIPVGTILTNPLTSKTYRTNATATIGTGGVTGKIRIDPQATPEYLSAIPSGTQLTFTPISGVNNPVAVAVNEEVRATCADSISSREQMRIPIGLGGPTAVAGDSVIYIWDVYYTQEWFTVAFNNEWSALKAYKPYFGLTATSNDVGWTMFSHMNAGNPDPAQANPANFAAWTQYRALGGPSVGYVNDENLMPTGLGAQPYGKYHLPWGKWIRYWMEIKFAQPGTAFTEWGDIACTGAVAQTLCSGASGYLLPNPSKADGTYMMISIWIAHEDRDAEPVLYRAPATTASTWAGRLDLEFGVSDSGFSRSVDLTAYVRNFITLQNYTLGPNAHQTDSVLFQRPVR
jgi:hypothetical protein